MSAINRSNWREHCAEPELTREEREQENALLVAIKAETLAGDETLAGFIVANTEPEQDAYIDAELPRSWALMPAYVDICRRRDRAEIRAWREWEKLAATAVKG